MAQMRTKMCLIKDEERAAVKEIQKETALSWFIFYSMGSERSFIKGRSWLSLILSIGGPQGKGIHEI
jgi:hypothetical protein